mgnify:CR=1 FL=1
MEACQLYRYIICKFTAGSAVEGRPLPTAAAKQWGCRPAFFQEEGIHRIQRGDFHQTQT